MNWQESHLRYLVTL